MPLASSTPADDTEPSWLSYILGGRSSSGDTIIEILQSSPKYFVYINQEGSLEWEYDDNRCINADDSSAVAMRLVSQVNTSVFGKRRRRRAFGCIADALANALANRRDEDDRDFFADAHVLVESSRM